jgi:hypothetical protein
MIRFNRSGKVRKQGYACKKPLESIKDAHIKKLHESGLMDLQHTHPWDIFPEECPIRIIDKYKELMNVFGNYLQDMISEACDRDKIVGSQVRYPDPTSMRFED